MREWQGLFFWGFWLAFWPGFALGVLQALNQIPAAWARGVGHCAILLGIRLHGLALCTAGFFVPLPRCPAGAGMARAGSAA